MIYFLIAILLPFAYIGALTVWLLLDKSITEQPYHDRSHPWRNE